VPWLAKGSETTLNRFIRLGLVAVPHAGLVQDRGDLGEFRDLLEATLRRKSSPDPAFHFVD
jgi:hypothetical protein